MIVYSSCCQLIVDYYHLYFIIHIIMANKDRNMVCDAIQPHKNGKENIENNVDDADNVEQVSEEEFKAINDRLDQLNLVLDNLESKNDSIHAELVKLLKSNREARKQFQESQENKQQ